MIKNCLNLFPTGVVVYNNFLSANQAKDIFEYCINDKETQTQYDAFVGQAMSSFDFFLKNKDRDFLSEIQNSIQSCLDLKTNIENLFNEYCNDTHIKNVQLSNSWYNFQNKDSILMMHNHKFSVLSSALYINVDENSSSIFFENPNPYADFCVDITSNDYYSSHYSIQPKIGDLVIFPSWLKHGSHHLKNRTENRLVISVNSYYRPH